MRILPYRRMIMRTRLSASEVCARLIEVIEPPRFRWIFDKSKPYQGRIEGLSFDLSRVIRYRNSFLPQIKGEIQPAAHGCQIHLTMHPYLFALIFVAIWFGIVGMAFLTMLVVWLLNPASDFSLLLVGIPGVMFVFGVTLVMVAFAMEANRAVAFFRNLFEVESVEEISISSTWNNPRT